MLLIQSIELLIQNLDALDPLIQNFLKIVFQGKMFCKIAMETIFKVICLGYTGHALDTHYYNIAKQSDWRFPKDMGVVISCPIISKYQIV